MKLNRCLLVAGCLASLSATTALALPQSDEITIKATVQTDDGGDSKESKDSKESEAKETKVMRLKLSHGPVALMLMKDGAAKLSTTQSGDAASNESAAHEVASPKIWLGVGLKEIEGDLATYLGSSEGVFVDNIFPDSPAEAAKLQAGDVILAFEGKKVTGPAELVKALCAITPSTAGDKADDKKSSDYPSVSVTILRRGQEMKIELKPVDRPKSLKLSVSEEGSPGEVAKIFKFGQPEEINRRLANPSAKLKTSSVIVIKENDNETIARIERDGEGPAKIVVTHNKQDKEFTEDQLDQLPEKVREAIKKALKAVPAAEGKSTQDAHSDAHDEIRLQLEKAMQQVGGGKATIELKQLSDSLGKLGNGRVIVIDPEKLQDVKKLAEDAKAKAKVWSEAAGEQARGFSTMPEQLKQLKQQVSELSKEVEMLKAEVKASKK